MREKEGTRVQRRLARKIEAKAIATGAWPPWCRSEFPHGIPNAGAGWTRKIRWAWHNGVYAVLARPIAESGDPRIWTVTHLAIRTVSQLEPTWAELQRIKNELMGEEVTAVQVYPAASRLIDEADMYHLWCYAAGHRLGFGLHHLDEFL